MIPLGSSEPLDWPFWVGPNPDGLFEGTNPVGALVAHVDDRVVAEIDRHVVPHARHDRDRLPDAVGLLLADRTDAPGTIAAATAAVGRDGDVLTGDGERALPAAHLREPLGVEDDRAPAAQILAWFLEGRDRCRPGDVHGDVGVVRLDDHPELLERFDDLHPHRADRDIHAVLERLRGPHDALGAVLGDRQKGVGRAEVGVLPEPEDREVLIG